MGRSISFANVPFLLGPAHPSSIPALRARSQNIMYIFRAFSESRILFVRYLLSCLYQIQTNLFILYIKYVGHLMSGMLLQVYRSLCTGRWPPDVHHPVTYHFRSRRPAVTSLWEFPCITPVRGPIIILFGCSPRRRPRFVCYLLSFCTEYDTICPFYTFCTWAT